MFVPKSHEGRLSTSTVHLCIRNLHLVEILGAIFSIGEKREYEQPSARGSARVQTA
jgi:hypothetical protein